MRADAPVVTLAPGRERSLRHRHPWIFSGAIERVDGEPGTGDDRRGRAQPTARWLALRRLFARLADPRARLVVRAARAIDAAFFAARDREAVAARAGLLDDAPHAAAAWCTASRTACRASSPTATATTVVLQLPVGRAPSAGAMRSPTRSLDAAAACACVYERSDADVRALEGLPPRTGVLRGDARRAACRMREDGLAYEVDVLARPEDRLLPRPARQPALVARLAQRPRRCSTAFCYTGGFTLAALAGGAARVRLGRHLGRGAGAARSANLARNPALGRRSALGRGGRLRRPAHAARRRPRVRPDRARPAQVRADRAARRARPRAPTRTSTCSRCKLLRRGGLLAHVLVLGRRSAPELFQKIVAGAALDARRDAQIVAPARPRAPTIRSRSHFPEGDYLKGLLLRRH